MLIGQPRRSRAPPLGVHAFGSLTRGTEMQPPRGWQPAWHTGLSYPTASNPRVSSMSRRNALAGSGAPPKSGGAKKFFLTISLILWRIGTLSHFFLGHFANIR